MARERTRLGSCAGQRARQEAGRVTDLRGRRALRRLGGKHEWRQHQQGAEAAAGGTRTCKRPPGEADGTRRGGRREGRAPSGGEKKAALAPLAAAKTPRLTTRQHLFYLRPNARRLGWSSRYAAETPPGSGRAAAGPPSREEGKEGAAAAAWAALEPDGSPPLPPWQLAPPSPVRS